MSEKASAPAISQLLRNRFVQAILLSGLFLQIGIWVRNFSILLFVMEKTNEDAFAVSMIYVAEFAPIFLFSFIGGTFADRWRPKRTMIWCDVLSALSLFAVMLTLAYGTWKAVFFATLISAILSQFSQPSGMKLFKLHVPEEQIQAGMSIYQTMFAVFMILGPVVGTFAYQHFGIANSIGFTGAMFLLSAAALLFLPKDRILEEQKQESTLREEMVQGFRYVLNSRFLTLLAGNFLFAGLAIGLIQPLGIFVVTERLLLPKEHLQWLMAVFGVAMIIGGGLALAFSKRISPMRLLALGMAVDAVMFSIIGFSTHLWLTLVAQFFSGLMMPAIHISINTMILQNTEGSFIGRVNGIMSPLFTGAMVVMMSVSGPFKEFTSLTTVYQASALLFVAGIVLVFPLLLQPGTRGEPDRPQEQAS